MYKIKRLSDGKFATGGVYNSFTQRGKVWSTLTGLKLHLQQFLRGQDYSPPADLYNGCVVIMYDDVNGCIKEDVFDIREYLLQKQQELIERDKQRQIKRNNYEAELRKLKEKYGR